MSKKAIALIIAGLFFIMMLVGGGFFFMWSQMQALQNPNAHDEDAAAIEDENEVGPMYSLNSFVVNLLDSGGKRYLRTTMELELSGEEVTTEVDKRLPQIRDAILMILPDKTLAEVQSAEGKNALRDQIIARLNEFLGEGKVTYIYFTEFVIQ